MVGLGGFAGGVWAVAKAGAVGCAGVVEAVRWVPPPLGRTGHHYAHPFDGACYMGDWNVTIQQLSGAFCSPPCGDPNSASPSCPELPGAKEHRAQVQCVLTQANQPRPTLCAILCLMDQEEGGEVEMEMEMEEEAAGGGLGIGGNCPGASVCTRVQDDVGICLYHGAKEWEDAPEEEKVEAARTVYDTVPAFTIDLADATSGWLRGDDDA